MTVLCTSARKQKHSGPKHFQSRRGPHICAIMENFLLLSNAVFSQYKLLVDVFMNESNEKPLEICGCQHIAVSYLLYKVL